MLDRRTFIVFTALAGALVPSAAFAAPPSEPALLMFADCVLAKDQGDSVALVRSAPGSDDEGKAFAALRTLRRTCGKRIAQDSGLPDVMLFRGLLAERLWRATSAAVPPEKGNEQFPHESAAEFTAHKPVEFHLAECVATNKPALANELARSDPGSKEEAHATAGLGEVLGDCVPFGVPIRMNRIMLRAMLAEQLYRRYAP